MKNTILTIAAVAMLTAACTPREAAPSLFILKNGDIEAVFTDYGARLVSLRVPDRDGRLRDVVLGFDSLTDYCPENNLSDFGAAIGRYANRIDSGRFTLDGRVYQLPRNNYGHCLHGGGEMGDLGWQYRLYDASQPDDSTLVLSIDSPDGDNGFPGRVRATVTYVLRSDNSLDISYEATTDAPTVINMTNHAYFNLSGDPSSPVTDHVLWVDADGYTPVDSTFMTYGTVDSVGGTPFDFRMPKAIGRDIGMDDAQLHNARGYDHNWVLATAGDIDRPALRVTSPASGITMEMYTTEPGVQIYTGNFLDGTVRGKGGAVYGRNAAVCFESQHYPDSPNKPQWPSTVLRPGETYRSRTIYRFTR